MVFENQVKSKELNNIIALAPTSRVWIYQSNRAFNDNEAAEIKQHISHFAQQWISHNQQLKAYGDLLHHQFLVLMVDESIAGASGCSIDKSVHFMKAIEEKYGVNLFDRLQFAYMADDRVLTASKTAFKTRYQNGEINDNTLVFDNLVDNKADFDRNWLKPLKESWHFRMV